MNYDQLKELASEMNVEKGWFKPAPGNPKFTKDGFVSYEISGKEYELVSSIGYMWWAAKKKGTWGRGLIKNPIKIGLLGELAFAKAFNKNVFIGRNKNKEDCNEDFLINGKKFEIKTSQRNYGSLLVRCVTDGGEEIDISKFDIYVSAIAMDQPENNKAIVHLVGWITSEELIKYPTVAPRKGKHMNKDVPYRDLHGMESLNV